MTFESSYYIEEAIESLHEAYEAADDVDAKMRISGWLQEMSDYLGGE